MKENLEVIFGVVGGLAIFLFGMNSMSDALQKAAGEKMKQILGFLTKNPIMGALAGMIVTAVLQSSSATTVMVIGFVSAGLMSLPQAISVIFGANIGTTMTAQLMAFKLSDYIYPIIFIGFLIYFLSKKERPKNIGMVIFSFGLLFEGIEIMGSVMKPLASSPIFVELMGKVADLPVLGVVLGMVMTLVVQSSSATIAVLQNFAAQAGPDGVTSVIGLAGAIPILLGDNIGTTITALIASIGQSKNAKRTAVAHSVFNITGSALFLCLIPVLTKFVQYISPKGDEIDIIARQIANAHTTFNIVCTLIWIPLLPVMVKIVNWIIRGDKEITINDFEPRFLDEKVLSQPVAAMYLASEEIRRLADYAGDMLGRMKDFICGNEPVASYNEFAEKQSVVKRLRESISTYITKLLSNGSITEIQAEQSAGLLFVTNNIDRIADRCQEIGEIHKAGASDKKSLSKEAVEELDDYMTDVCTLFEQSITAVCDGDVEIAKDAAKMEKKMRKKQRSLGKSHLSRVKKGKCDAAMTNIYTEMLYNIDRVADNCLSIAEEAEENISFVDLKANANIEETIEEVPENA